MLPLKNDQNAYKASFYQIKDAITFQMHHAWTPLTKTSPSLAKDLFANTENIQKLGIRMLHIFTVAVLGCGAAIIATLFIIKIPLLSFALASATVGGALACVFYPEKIKNLVAQAERQICKLRSHTAL